jgi:hypothetical protein
MRIMWNAGSGSLYAAPWVALLAALSECGG